MDEKLCRELNYMSLKLLAQYLGESESKVLGLYRELLADKQFLRELNDQIRFVRRYYQEGIFARTRISSVDWMSIQRIVQYILVRLYKPTTVLETGVFYGGSTCFILNGLRRNRHGNLMSIDLPGQLWATRRKDRRHHLVGKNEDVPGGLEPGFIVHKNLRSRWNLILGDSHKEIKKIDIPIDFYNHDSEHSFRFLNKEADLVWPKLTKKAIIMADDLNWSNGFFGFCVRRKLYPLILTDNGKSGILARTGILKLDHQFNKKVDVVG